MYKTTAILASLVGASAFAPSARVARSTGLKMAFENGECSITRFFALSALI
jgi:Spy/CpxP family protein refolding chaperone